VLIIVTKQYLLAPNDKPDQAGLNLFFILPSAQSSDPLQTIRNRELADIAFPNELAPKYGPAMLQPQFCGKWAVGRIHTVMLGF
jgi:hypothetical protein